MAIETTADLLDGLAQLRVTFKRNQLEPPSVLLLKSHEEGMRFLTAVRQMSNWQVAIGSQSLGTPIEMADGSAYMSIRVMDFEVRWPANRYATPDGSWSYA